MAAALGLPSTAERLHHAALSQDPLLVLQHRARNEPVADGQDTFVNGARQSLPAGHCALAADLAQPVWRQLIGSGATALGAGIVGGVVGQQNLHELAWGSYTCSYVRA